MLNYLLSDPLPGVTAKITHSAELRGGEGKAPLNRLYPWVEILTVE